MNYDYEKLNRVLRTQSKFSYNDLARAMGVRTSENQDFSRFLMSAVSEGKLFLTKSKLYYLPKFLFKVTDKLQLNPKGFGFIDFTVNGSQTKQSAFIAPTSINKAMNNDIVEVEVFNDLEVANSFQGVVRKIVTRNKLSFVGTVVISNDGVWVKPIDLKVLGKFKLLATNGEKMVSGLYIKVELVNFGDSFHEVKLAKFLGNKDDISIDILSEIENAGIRHSFDRLLIKEADSLPQIVSDSEIARRVDLRKNYIVTIDGDDTKDFDDAIEVKVLENGNFLLCVHIADVTHYVKENSHLDNEAQMRGTSVYLADRVIPMLPYQLSNGICSLNPNEDRLVISVDIEIDKFGNNVSYKIYEGVINSRYRLTYQEVNSFYDGKKNFNDDNLHKMLNDALALSKIIRAFKENQGYIDFEIEESKIIIDSNGKTVDIVPRERYKSEMLIEDFMVRANEVIAEHVTKNKLSFIYRVHAKPDLKRLESLQGVIKTLGIKVTVPTHANPKEFAVAINQIKATRFDDFMKVMFLRTMAKAEYSPKNIGHFGLASQYYTHFTSPIRRYPDLMVHRMLRTYFFENKPEQTKHFGKILESIAIHSSSTEVTAADLERRVDDIKKAEFYTGFIGQTFLGTIVSVLSFGFFVEFPNKAGGLVHASTLIDDVYTLVENSYSFQSRSKTFKLGDKISVVVVGAIKEEGRIDLVVASMYSKWKEISNSRSKSH